MEDVLGGPISVRVARIIRENERARTILFERVHLEKPPRAGQFLMVWVPGVDEIPMSISMINERYLGFTVVPIGEATSALTSLQEGEWIGVRGPFGNGFSLCSGTALIVGGGSGVAALRPLIYELIAHKTRPTVILAARTGAELLFRDEFSEESEITLIITTDDGTVGKKGVATDAMEELIAKHKFDKIYTCGPELMMKQVWRLAARSDTPIEVSLERYMKCGCGICGSCGLDPTGDLVCTTGPVFTGEYLTRISEFGEYHRDSMGVKRYYTK